MSKNRFGDYSQPIFLKNPENKAAKFLINLMRSRFKAINSIMLCRVTLCLKLLFFLFSKVFHLVVVMAVVVLLECHFYQNLKEKTQRKYTIKDSETEEIHWFLARLIFFKKNC